MKQRRHGKKVYNWHRPLGRSQLRRRFLRARDTFQSVEAELQRSNENADLADFSIFPYEISNYCCEDCYREAKGYADDEDRQSLSVRMLLDSILRPSQWLLDLERVGERLNASAGRPSSIAFPERSEPVEERLAQHLQLLNSQNRDELSFQRALGQRTFDIRPLQLVRRVSQDIGTPHFGRLILLFAPFWIRDPLDWDDSGEAWELVRFLFVKHEAPGFLFPAWLHSDGLSEIHLKWVMWLIIIGQGGSLKRASRHFPWAVSGKVQQYLSEVPKEFSPEEAARLAETRRLGGSLTTFQRLREFHFFHFDPSDGFYEHRSFWEATVRWLSKHEAELSDDDCHDILQWAVHQHTERLATGGFSWKNRTVAACLRNADAYLASLNFTGQNASWKAKGWDMEAFEDESGVSWSVVELLNGHSLVKEGQCMRHCVALYSIRCQNGDCAIFSLRREGVREITVEIDLRQRRVAQARGKFNRPAHAAEQAVISRWFATVMERNTP